MNSQLSQSLRFVGLLTVFARPLIAATILFGLWRALKLARISSRARGMAWWSVALFLVGWLGGVWTLAAEGAFASLSGAAPALGLAVLVAVLLGVAVMAVTGFGRSASLAAAIDAAPLSWLIGVQVYRILGFVFLRLWSRGSLPGYFALPAGVGDMLVGITALPLAFNIRSNSRFARRLALVWNVFGILDLVNAVTMGVTSSLAHSSPVAYPLVNYPLVMVPMFGVPLALILHILSLRQLRRRAIAASSAGHHADVLSPEHA